MAFVIIWGVAIVCFAVLGLVMKAKIAREESEETEETTHKEVKNEKQESALRKLEKDAEIAKVDIKYLQPLLERKKNHLYFVVEREDTTLKEVEKAEKEYYDTLKKLMRAQNKVAAYESALNA